VEEFHMTSRCIQIAAGQILVQGAAVDANLARAEEMIQEAGAAACELIVLPECLDVGPGPRTRRLGRAAADAGVVVAAGLTERSGNVVYNSAVILDRNGSLCLLHRKINVLEMAQHLYQIGDRLGVAQTDLGSLGLNICADNFPNTLDIGTTIRRLGAQILLSPSAWAVDGDHDNEVEPYGALWQDAYGRLAQSCQMPVIGASNIGPIDAGPWRGRRCIGCSLVIDAAGQTVAMGPYDEPALVTAEVEISNSLPRGTSISGML
jgi:predicted amidohydrolase